MRTLIPLLGMLLLFTGPVQADRPPAPRVCAEPGLAVIAADTVDAELVCEGARQAVVFLRGLGLEIPADLALEVVDSLPPLYGAEQLGSFDATTGRLRVLSYDSCDQIGHDALLFGWPLDRDLYRSLVAHEVAHAVVGANYSGDEPRLVPQEYVAYATQFAAMSPRLRDAILRASRISAFADEHEMSALRYFLDPQAFGIAAYRHFAAQSDPSAFVWRLLRGDVRFDASAGY